MPVIFISQHSASDSNKPERNTCRFNQVTKHVKYLSWNEGVWHMKCEPLRSPSGDVIFSDLDLFTASADTFKRKKKKISPRTGVRIQNKSLSMGLLGAKDTNTGMRTHTHTYRRINAHTHTCTFIHSCVSVQVCILNKRYPKNSLCWLSSNFGLIKFS